MKLNRNEVGIRTAGAKSQRGVGLVEILIAILVFTVGMVGMVSMQLGAKRATYEAEQRSLATGIARDIIERMRSNPANLDSYVVDTIGDPNDPAVLPSPNCNLTNCSPAQLAVHDLAEWEVQLQGGSEILAGANAGGLVEPRACITHVDGLVTVAIAWLGIQAADNPAASTCGNDVTGLYDDPDGAVGNNLRRRLLVVSTFISST